MKITDLPPEVAEILVTCPKAGDGVNNFIIRAAWWLHWAGVPEADMPSLIEAATENCGRSLVDGEIDRAIVKSGRYFRGEIGAERRTPKWPKANPEQIQAIVRDGPKLQDLREWSPVKWADRRAHTDEVLDGLFPGNPLLCIGMSKFKFHTRPRNVWRGRLSFAQFIVPSPMSKVTGLTKEGKVSEHALENTGPRRFLVIEFDPPKWGDLSTVQQARFGEENAYFDARRDEHASILAHLSYFAPFVMAVHSASKSIHGWFYVQHWSENETEDFFRYAVSLGADKQLWVRSQFVRLPDGFRPDKQKRQLIIYYNPSLIHE